MGRWAAQAAQEVQEVHEIQEGGRGGQAPTPRHGGRSVAPQGHPFSVLRSPFSSPPLAGGEGDLVD